MPISASTGRNSSPRGRTTSRRRSPTPIWTRPNTMLRCRPRNAKCAPVSSRPRRPNATGPSTTSNFSPTRCPMRTARRSRPGSSAQERDDLAYAVTLPVSDNPTYTAFNNTAVNDRQLKEWHDVTRPRLVGSPRQMGQARPDHRVGCRTPCRHPGNGDRGGLLLVEQLRAHLRRRQIHRRPVSVLPARKPARPPLHQRPVPVRNRIEDHAGQRRHVRDCEAGANQRRPGGRWCS